MQRRLLFVAAFFFLIGARAVANPMLHADNGAVVDGSGSPVLLRCVNLSPWLNPEPYLVTRAFHAALRSPTEFRQKLAEAAGAEYAQNFWRQWEENFVTETDFEHLAARGFNCVRLPLNARSLLAPSATGLIALSKDGLAPIDRAVEWGEKYGIYVIIDLHTAPGGQNPQPTVADVPSDDKTPRLWSGSDAERNQSLTAAIWHLLAAHYANARSVGGYDLLNEPALPSDAPKDAIPKLYRAIVAQIRAVDPDHMIIIEGDGYAHDFAILQPPPDPNTMYEFHEYAIFNKYWKKPSQEHLQQYIEMRDATHMPLWLGEFGEDTMAWQGQMVDLMKANGIGWAVWPWKRVDLGSHPVIETIIMPDAWNRLSRYAADAMFTGKPSQDEARQAMTQMLEAIRSENCKEDTKLEAMLAGQ